jgi:hypothetical protein
LGDLSQGLSCHWFIFILLNEGSDSEQPTRPVDLRDDGVDIDLPSREEIEGTLKYLKNNKAAGADSNPGPLD